METINPIPVEFSEINGDNQTTYSWTRNNEIIAEVRASGENSNFPKIEFNIREKIVPYYEEDKKSALDEIGEMSMYTDMQTRVEDEMIVGSMRCSHNASLGVGSFVQSVKGWISKI